MGENAPVLALDEGLQWAIGRISELERGAERPVLVGISGASASGKSSRVTKALTEAFEGRSCLVTMDDYYRGIKYAKEHGLNLDQPEELDIALLAEHIRRLKSGKAVSKPTYDKGTGEPTPNSETVAPNRIIFIEGIFALVDELAKELDVRIFVDVGAHGRIIRRLMRDSEKGKSIFTVLGTLQYLLQTCEPMYSKYVEPTRKNADVIIDNDYNAHREAVHSRMSESQAKFKTDLDADKLLKIGAERIMGAKQTDYYYVPRDGSFGRTGEFLRLRKEGDHAVLTYKGPKSETEHALERSKFEFEIDDGSERALPLIYDKLSVTVSKDRSVYLLDGVVFTFDSNVRKASGGESRELGNFIELRTKGVERQKALAVRELLGIGSEKPILKSYFDM